MVETLLFFKSLLAYIRCDRPFAAKAGFNRLEPILTKLDILRQPDWTTNSRALKGRRPGFIRAHVRRVLGLPFSRLPLNFFKNNDDKQKNVAPRNCRNREKSKNSRPHFFFRNRNLWEDLWLLWSRWPCMVYCVSLHVSCFGTDQSEAQRCPISWQRDLFWTE